MGYNYDKENKVQIYDRRQCAQKAGDKYFILVLKVYYRAELFLYDSRYSDCPEQAHDPPGVKR